MKIALFGGSFNPIHTDHVLICKYLHNVQKFNEVWIIPTRNHPFQKSINNTDYHRINMIELAIKNNRYIKLKKYELNRGSDTSYTVNTLKHFKKNYPNYKFELIIGSDNIEKIHLWKDIEYINRNFNILCLTRGHIKDSDYENINKYNITISEVKLFNISSTDIRNGINTLIQINSINKYINYHKLYLDERLNFNFNNTTNKDKTKERFLHSVNVADMALQLAKIHKSNVHNAFIAGKLHDITKFWKKEKHIQYINKYCKKYVNEPLPTLHSYSAYAYLKYELKYNKKIVNAIKKHTTASNKMNKLDKIIFIADKISSERNYEGLKSLRELAFKNLDFAFKKILKLQYERALEKNSDTNIGIQIKKSIKKWI